MQTYLCLHVCGIERTPLSWHWLLTFSHVFLWCNFTHGVFRCVNEIGIELCNSSFNSVEITLACCWQLENWMNSLHGPSESDFGTIMAEVLRKQRKIRGGHRAHVKKLLAQVEDSIANFEPTLQDKLSQQKIILKSSTPWKTWKARFWNS